MLLTFNLFLVIYASRNFQLFYSLTAFLMLSDDIQQVKFLIFFLSSRVILQSQVRNSQFKVYPPLKSLKNSYTQHIIIKKYFNIKTGNLNFNDITNSTILRLFKNFPVDIHPSHCWEMSGSASSTRCQEIFTKIARRKSFCSSQARCFSSQVTH